MGSGGGGRKSGWLRSQPFSHGEGGGGREGFLRRGGAGGKKKEGGGGAVLCQTAGKKTQRFSYKGRKKRNDPSLGSASDAKEKEGRDCPRLERGKKETNTTDHLPKRRGRGTALLRSENLRKKEKEGGKKNQEISAPEAHPSLPAPQTKNVKKRKKRRNVPMEILKRPGEGGGKGEGDV